MRFPLRFELSESVRSKHNAAKLRHCVFLCFPVIGFVSAQLKSAAHFTSRFAVAQRPAAVKSTNHIAHPPKAMPASFAVKAYADAKASAQ